MTTQEDVRQFPILQPKFGAPREYVPWALVEPHAQQAVRNHGQTLERLAERGGLAWAELVAVLEDRAITKMPEADARACALAYLTAEDDHG